MGSKRRIAKELIDVILNDVGDNHNGTWIEPFVGGCNMIDKVPDTFERIGCDVNKYLIALFKELQKGWEPPKVCTEETYKEMITEYRAIRDSKDLPFGERKFTDFELGFYGFCCSFGGRFMEGYAREKGSNETTFAIRGYNNLTKQLPNIQTVDFGCINYLDLGLNDLSHKHTIIYCDPPYKDTQGYKAELNHNEFYDWCIDLYNKGFKNIYISEYEMPEDKFECIWEKDLGRTGISNTEHKSMTRKQEKLFKVR